MVWFGRGQVADQPPREVAAHASEAYRNALALDSTLAEVQYAVALNRIWGEWDWEGGEAAFRKAIEINPNYPDARASYAAFLATMERVDEARVQIDRALELDPLNPVSRFVNGFVLNYERRHAEAIEEVQAALRSSPDNSVAISDLADAYHLNGDYDEALATVRRWYPGDQELDEALDRGYAEGGYRGAMLRYAETLAARPGAAERLSYVLATAYAYAGERERTLEWLELAYQAHEHDLNVANHPILELVHNDPRYQALRRRMGLPER
jgi:tetratricopeptide (TPR) repeat protein